MYVRCNKAIVFDLILFYVHNMVTMTLEIRNSSSVLYTLMFKYMYVTAIGVENFLLKSCFISSLGVQDFHSCL